MKFLQNLQAVSAVLFYVLGICFFTAFLFWRNNTFAYEAELFVRYGDLPFAFVCIVLAGVSIRLAVPNSNTPVTQSVLEEEGHPVLDAVLLLVGLGLMLGLLYVDLALPDVM